MSSNPFISSLKRSDAATANPMARIVGNKAPQTQDELRNVFKIPLNVSLPDPENNRNASNQAIATATLLGNAPTHPSKSLPSQPLKPAAFSVPAAAQVFRGESDKAQLEVRLNGQACQVSKQTGKQLGTAAELSVLNLKVAVPEPLRAQLASNIAHTQSILNGISALEEAVCENNEVILSAVRHSPSLPPSKQLHDRLKQGLYYYQPSSDRAMDVLKLALQSHPLWRATSAVAQRCGLDVLKAYYVVRSVHEQRGDLRRGSGFFIAEPLTPLPEGEVEGLALKFLEADKLNLLQVYCSVLNGSRWRNMRVFTFQEEMDILWGNLCCIPRESPDVQEAAVELFLKYWSVASEEQRTRGSELCVMRQRLLALRLRDSLRTKLMAIGIDSLLRLEGSECSASDFEGPFWQLFQFFLQKDHSDFNFAAAFANLKRVELSKEWFRHVESVVKTVSFEGNSRHCLQVGLYLYLVLAKLREKEVQLPERLQEEFVVKVIKNCSIILGIVFLDSVFKQLSSLALIGVLTKYVEKDIRIGYSRDGSVIFKEVEGKLSLEEVVRARLGASQRLLVGAVESGDVESLEREASNGRVYWLDLEQPALTFRFFRACCLELAKFPSFHTQVQQNLQELLLVMRSRQISVASSLGAYHDKLISLACDPCVLAAHLGFLLQLAEGKLCEYLQEWISRVEKLGIVGQLSQFPQLIALVAAAILERDEQGLLAVFLDLLRLFRDRILALARQSPASVQALRVLYWTSRVGEWSTLGQEASSGVVELAGRVRECVRREGGPVGDLLQTTEPLGPAARLVVACELLGGREKPSDCLNGFLSLHEQLRLHFYDRITQELRSEAGSVVLEAFSSAAQFDRELFQVLMLKNLPELLNFLKSQTSSLATLHHQLILAMEIAAAPDSPSHPHAANLSSLLASLVARTLRSARERPLPAPIAAKLLRVCAQAMNRLEYTLHVESLRAGLGGDSRVGAEGEFVQLAAYLVCLFAARARRAEVESQRSRTGEEAELFGAVARLLLRSSSPLDSLAFLFLRKYLQVIEFLLDFALFHQLASHQFAALRDSFSSRAKSSQELQTLTPGLERISRLIDRRSQPEPASREDGAGQSLQKSLSALGRVSGSERRQLLRELQTAQTSGRARLSAPLSLGSLLGERSLGGLEAVLRVARAVEWRACARSTGRQLQEFLGSFELEAFSGCPHDWLCAFRLYLETCSELVDAAALSPFLLLAGAVRERIVGGLKGLAGALNSWQGAPPGSALLGALESIELLVSYQPPAWRGLRAQDSFTLWEVLLLRQKVELLAAAVRFHRVMNGLLPPCALPDSLLPFLAFLAHNAHALASPRNADSLRAANSLLERAAAGSSERWLVGAVSLEQIGRVCVGVGEELSYLNCEPSAKAYELLEKLRQSA